MDGEGDTETNEKPKLTVHDSNNSFFFPPVLQLSLAFQYGKQICSFGQNERTAWALFAELGAAEAAICDTVVELMRAVAMGPTGPRCLSLLFERLVMKVTEGT